MFELSDFSILIPIRIDSDHRLKNLEIVIDYFRRFFVTNIYIYESDMYSRVDSSLFSDCVYRFLPDQNYFFHRTRILNQLIMDCQTQFAMIYDADVLFNPEQLFYAADLVRERRCDFALPYDGRFLQVDKYTKQRFYEHGRMSTLLNAADLLPVGARLSVGGCFVLNVDLYLKCGLENEYIVGWGHDDVERVKRVRKLGYRLFRVEGPLFHLFHPRKTNSYFFDRQRAFDSFSAYFNTCKVDRIELVEKIKSYPWIP